MVNSSKDMYGVKATPQLTVSYLCHQLASLLETPLITQDVFCSENLFVNQSSTVLVKRMKERDKPSCKAINRKG